MTFHDASTSQYGVPADKPRPSGVVNLPDTSTNFIATEEVHSVDIEEASCRYSLLA